MRFFGGQSAFAVAFDVGWMLNFDEEIVPGGGGGVGGGEVPFKLQCDSSPADGKPFEI